MGGVCQWRGSFRDTELECLHGESFEGSGLSRSRRPWVELTEEHSLGWVVARREARLGGFVNVLWDGFSHAWIQDLMVAPGARGQGLGKALVDMASEEARSAGCEWLHVDFEHPLTHFYFDACGFAPTHAGLMKLR